MPPTLDFLAELKWRGLFHQCTDEAGLRQHLAGGGGTRRAYAGFDPTSDSLTIGNLVPMMLLLHFQRAGHEPVVVMGGGTGLIGDPSGKSAERQLMTEEQVRAHVEAQRPIFERVFRHGAEIEQRAAKAPTIVNNLDWLGKLGYLEVLRDAGKHFSVNMMIQKDSVRERLHARDQGISYTEFSYMILQAFDYQQLWRNHDVTLQMGGSDQWGNIVAGRELITKSALVCVTDLAHSRVPPGATRSPMVALAEAHPRALEADYTFGLTAPLITKSDGGKFGKTESGAIWLTPERTSPYDFYQFWLNAADADVGRYLRFFTLLDEPTIKALEAQQAASPGERTAQRRLAREVTTLVHGGAEADQAEHAGRALFSGELTNLSAAQIDEVLAEAPRTEHDKALLAPGLSLADLLPLTTLCKSKREARELLQSGSISVNGRRVGPEDKLGRTDLLHGTTIALRRGKKTWHLTRWR